MSSPTAPSPVVPPRPGGRALSRLRRLAAVAWAGSGLAILSLWLQYQCGVYHTNAWLWLPPAAAGLLAAGAALFLGAAGVLLGPRRAARFGWLLLGVVPLLLAAGLAGYMVAEQT